MTTKQLLMYVPVVHRGYEAFVRRHGDADEILVLGSSFHAWFPQLTKDIRALEPAWAARDLRTRVPAVNVRVVETNELDRSLNADTIIMPDEDIMRQLSGELNDRAAHAIRFESTWLRYDRQRTLAAEEVEADETSALLPPKIQAAVTSAARRSSDWWRQVGAGVTLQSGLYLETAHNHHLPTDYSPYIDGDPRSNFSRGQNLELSTAIHAEADLIARCAREGEPLKGALMLVTTFPCPPCAKLIAASGISELYFIGGYAALDGVKVLRDAGVKLIRVEHK